MAQEEETEHTAEERSSQERAVQLAKLQAAGLISLDLTTSPCISVHFPISLYVSLYLPISPYISLCLQAAGLVDVPAALHLLRVAARNQFHLFDAEERDRGNVMYPQACIPIPYIPIPTSCTRRPR